MKRILGLQALAFCAIVALSARTATGTTYAKLSGGQFAYYSDIDCTTEVSAPETGIAGCVVLFGSDAEYQALVPYTNELATAFSVVLQNNVSLTADADWRAFDFDMNEKTVSLQGWDLIVHKPQGTGRFTSGNLINPLGFSTANGAYRSGDWWTFAGKPYGDLNIYQDFTVPKARNVYVRFKTRSWNKSGYAQYVSAGIDSLDNLVSKFQSGTGSSANTYIKATDIYTRSGLAAGSTHQLRATNHSGWTYAGFFCISPTSYLTFDIPEDEEYVNSGITLGGANDDDFTGIGLQVYKTGKGLLTMSLANIRFGKNGNTSLVVQEGVVSKANSTAATCGAQYSRIVVQDGAQFNLNGRTYHDYDYTLAGSGPDGTGALTSTAELTASAAYANNTQPAFMRNVALSSDATVYAANNMAMIFYNYTANTMTLNGHAVTYDGEGTGTGVGAYRIFLGNMSYSGAGKIVVAKNGWVQTHVSSPTAADADIEVYGRFWMNTGRLTPVKSLVFMKGSLFRELNETPAAMVVYAAYAPPPNSESEGTCNKRPLVQLGDSDHDETTFDLSRWTTTFDDSEEGTLTFAENSYVTVDIGGRMPTAEPVYKWKPGANVPPTSVTFRPTAAMAERGWNVVRDDENNCIYVRSNALKLRIK